MGTRVLCASFYVVQFSVVVSHPCARKEAQGWSTGFCGERKEGGLSAVVSHPCDKNKDVAWMGHGVFGGTNGRRVGAVFPRSRIGNWAPGCNSIVGTVQLGWSAVSGGR